MKQNYRAPLPFNTCLVLELAGGVVHDAQQYICYGARDQRKYSTYVIKIILVLFHFCFRTFVSLQVALRSFCFKNERQNTAL